MKKLTLNEDVSAGRIDVCEFLGGRESHLLAVHSPARQTKKKACQKYDVIGARDTEWLKGRVTGLPKFQEWPNVDKAPEGSGGNKNEAPYATRHTALLKSYTRPPGVPAVGHRL